MGLTLECKIHSWLQEIDPKFRATDFYQEQDPFRQNFTDRHLCYANESTPAKSHDLMERLPGNLRPELTPDPFASIAREHATGDGQTQSERQYNPFERKPRRKTREGRYDPWPVTRGNASGIPRKRMKSRNLRIRKGNSRISDRFVATNVKSTGVTEHPGSRLGIFKNGKASSPVHISKKAPYLNFVELDFLSKREKRERNDPVNGIERVGANHLPDGVTSELGCIQHKLQPDLTHIPDRFSPLIAPSVIDEDIVATNEACMGWDSLKDGPEERTSGAGAREKEGNHHADRPAYNDQLIMGSTTPVSFGFVNPESNLGRPNRMESDTSPATSAHICTCYTLEDLKTLGNMINPERSEVSELTREKRGSAAEELMLSSGQDHTIRTGHSSQMLSVAPSDDPRQTLGTKSELDLGPCSEIFGPLNLELNGAGRFSVNSAREIGDAACCSRLFEPTDAMDLPELSSPLPWGPQRRSAHPIPAFWDKDESGLASSRQSNKPPDLFGPFGSLGKNPGGWFRDRRTVPTAPGVLNSSTVLPIWYNDHHCALEPRKQVFWRANKLY